MTICPYYKTDIKKCKFAYQEGEHARIIIIDCYEKETTRDNCKLRKTLDNKLKEYEKKHGL